MTVTANELMRKSRGLYTLCGTTTEGEKHYAVYNDRYNQKTDHIEITPDLADVIDEWFQLRSKHV